MLYLNLGYQWAVPSIGNYGVCIGAHGVDSQSALTRPGRSKLPPPDRRFFDPQLYLNTLDHSDCEKVVERLVTHSWFNPMVLGPGEGQSIREWRHQIYESAITGWPYSLPDDPNRVSETIYRCLNFQREFGVCKLIIPGPVTRDPESDFSREAKWMDLGLDVVPEDSGLPVYATLVISDMCLVHRDPDKSELLAVIVDQIAARPGLDGVYLVLEQTVPPDSTYLMDSRIAWALLKLCYDLGVRASLGVVVNYVDVFGLVCLAAGAEAFCAGPTIKAGRFCLGDFEARGGGGAFPRFYSNSLILDLLPKRDMEDRIAKKRLLRYLEGDETEASRPLLEALKAKQPVDQIGEWQERRNNTSASHAHYIERITRATEKLLSSNDKITSVLNWLQDAEKDASYLADRFETDPLSADHRHVSAWRSAFESFLDQYRL